MRRARGRGPWSVRATAPLAVPKAASEAAGCAPVSWRLLKSRGSDRRLCEDRVGDSSIRERQTQITIFIYLLLKEQGLQRIAILIPLCCLLEMDKTIDARIPAGRKCTSKRKHVTLTGSASRPPKNKKVSKTVGQQDRDGRDRQQQMDNVGARSLDSDTQAMPTIGPVSYRQSLQDMSPSSSPRRVAETVVVTDQSISEHTVPAESGESISGTRVSSTLDITQSLASMQESLLSQMKQLIASAMTQQPPEASTSTGTGALLAHRHSRIRASQVTREEGSDSASEDEALHSGDEEFILSDDADEASEPQTTSGLFRADLFKTLLNKAKAITFLSDKAATPTEADRSSLQETAQLLLAPQMAKTEEVPAPLLVTDTV